VRLVYAESLPLQAAADWGVPVAGLLLALVLAGALQVGRRLQDLDDIAIGAGCAVIAVLVHELADFGLEFPGVAFPTLVALGLVLGRIVEKDRERWTKTRLPFSIALAGLAVWAVSIGSAALAVPHTVDEDWERCKRLVDVGENKKARDELDVAIVRHPAFDYFELLRAQSSTDDALKHANRALLLHPANPLTHSVAANLLLRSGHRQQAALEMRLSGVGPSPDMLRKLGDDSVDAVAQTPEALFNLAKLAATHGRAKVVERALNRAVDSSTNPDDTLVEALRLAGELKQDTVGAQLASDVLRMRPDAAGYAAAAKALARAGKDKESAAAIEAGLHDYPGTPVLILTGARLRFEHGDTAAARALLKTPTQKTFTLPERRLAEELIADIDDRTGDPVGASAARARARMFGAKLGGTARP
jgi:predicted Zn-dependent protease